MGCVPTKDTSKSQARRGPGEKIDTENCRLFAKYFCYLDATNVLHLYNIQSSEYRVITHTPMSDGTFQTAFAKIGSRIYLAGGSIAQKPHSQCILLKITDDGKVGERTDIAEMCVEKMGNALVAVGLNSLYSLGGFADKKSLNTCEKYDIEKNTWALAPALSEKKGSVAYCVFKSEIIYAFGGRLDKEKCEFSSKIELLDTTKGLQWEVAKLKESSYTGNYASCCCAQFNTDILICGGLTGNGYFYKPSTNEMVDASAVMGELPNNTGFQMSMHEYNGTLYVSDSDLQLLTTELNKPGWKAKKKEEWVKGDRKAEPSLHAHEEPHNNVPV